MSNLKDNNDKSLNNTTGLPQPNEILYLVKGHGDKKSKMFKNFDEAKAYAIKTDKFLFQINGSDFYDKKMELSKSILKEKDPLSVAFFGELKCSKEMTEYNLNDFVTRDERSPILTVAVICDFNWLVYDKEKIQQIINLILPRCDDGTSFQCLWERDGINYTSLFLDFNSKNKNIFDSAVANTCKILKISIDDKYKKYISSIEVAYPETWL